MTFENIGNNIMTEAIIETLERKYWIFPVSEEKKQTEIKENPKVSNTVALIVSSLTKHFPELNYSSDNKFINFQNEITKIIYENYKQSK